MTHQFRPRKSSSGTGTTQRRRGRSREGLPKTDNASDLELLPEIDYGYFDQMTPAELAKAAKSAKIPIDQPRHMVIEQLLAKKNEEFGAV
jgi:transcription termination factor Rho